MERVPVKLKWENCLYWTYDCQSFTDIATSISWRARIYINMWTSVNSTELAGLSRASSNTCSLGGSQWGLKWGEMKVWHICCCKNCMSSGIILIWNKCVLQHPVGLVWWNLFPPLGVTVTKHSVMKLIIVMKFYTENIKCQVLAKSTHML